MSRRVAAAVDFYLRHFTHSDRPPRMRIPALPVGILERLPDVDVGEDHMRLEIGELGTGKFPPRGAIDFSDFEQE